MKISNVETTKQFFPAHQGRFGIWHEYYAQESYELTSDQKDQFIKEVYRAANQARGHEHHWTLTFCSVKCYDSAIPPEGLNDYNDSIDCWEEFSFENVPVTINGNKYTVEQNDAGKWIAYREIPVAEVAQ